METTCPKCGDVLLSSTAACYRCADVGRTYASSGSSASMVFGVIGFLVIVVGVILIIGNMTGLFPTFPFAGYLTTVLGGLLFRLGGSN